MKDEDIIGKEFEGVYFEDVPQLRFNDIFHKCMIGRTGVVMKINKTFPHLCLIKFSGIGERREVHFPVAVVKQQIEDRTPIDLDSLFNQIKSL